MKRFCLTAFVFLSASCLLRAEDPAPAWTRAYQAGPPTPAETRDFIRRLARYAFDNHLKQDAASEQRGMLYEYFAPRRKGQFDQFIQGEALDTMHDGCWFGAAMAHAHWATGDRFYKDFLTQWQLPFYLKMLNHSDELFNSKVNHARPKAQGLWSGAREWLLQDGEKGFVPYWWDDGGSVSLERRLDKNPLPAFPSFDKFIAQDKPNPQFLLAGYSFGSSNHMAQDLGVLVEQAWFLLKDSSDPADQKLLKEVVDAAENLQACRMNHHGHIPMSDAPAALAGGDAKLMRHVPDAGTAAAWNPDDAYFRILYNTKPGVGANLPGFADDQEYRYYAAIAKHAGQLPRRFAFRVVYEAFAAPILYRYYSDDAEVPPGINVFDLHPFKTLDGKLLDYRSDRKGPSGKPRPAGSRMGPQNMVSTGWALQVLQAMPDIWEERYRREFADDARVYIDDTPPGFNTESKLLPLAAVELAGAKLRLHSTRGALVLDGQCPGKECVLKIFSRPKAAGSHAVVTVKQDKTVTAVNDRGEPLLVEAIIEPTAGGFTIQSLRIPYSVNKSQKLWANGVEHGRYSVQVGDDVRNFYLASSKEQVQAWLEHELAGGIRTWDAIFREYGYIPTGINAGGSWNGLSDSGGYAHLISAASQWLIYRDGKRDWELYRIPALSETK